LFPEVKKEQNTSQADDEWGDLPAKSLILGRKTSPMDKGRTFPVRLVEKK